MRTIQKSPLMTKFFFLSLAGAALLFFSSALYAAPVKFRIGTGAAAEEQLWLMVAKPDLTPNQGKLYTLEFTRFRGTDKRFQGYEARAIDGGTASANSAIFAASAGVKFKILASLSRESKRGAVTKYLVRSDSGIRSVKDLKGKIVGINGFKSSIHLWARLVLQKAGLDPEKDVRYAPVRFPMQGQALRSGKIDVGAFPQPFAMMEEKKGGLELLFTSKDAVPYEEELMVLFFNSQFINDHPKAVRAFLSDLRAATTFWLKNKRQARQALIDAKMVRMPPKTFFEMPDYYRPPDNRVDLESMKKMQEMQIKAEWQENRIDIESLVDMSYLPK